MESPIKALPKRAQNKTTRRTPEELDSAIFEAVIEELADVGYDRLSLVGVAERADTGRQAVYNRWSSKDDMIVDAFAALLPAREEFVSSGGLREDLIAYLPRLGGTRGVIDRAARSVTSAHHRQSKAMASLREQLAERNLARLRQVLTAAVNRGEASPCCLDPHVLEVFPAVMLRQQRLDKESITALVDKVFLPLVTRSQPVPSNAHSRRRPA